LWLDSPAQCPQSALGFDFDEAAFIHIGDKVTFEVLMASFGLEDDPALVKLAAMVHALDVGGATSPDASGFEASCRVLNHWSSCVARTHPDWT
jgi:hypothetical protein